MDLCQLSALELGKKIKVKEVGVVEATKAVLENIEKKEKNDDTNIEMDSEEDKEEEKISK